MVDMARTRDEKEELVGGAPQRLDPVDFVGDYPAGLCLSWDEEILEKLDLDDDIELGDTVDIRAFAKVCSVSKTNDHCRIELQITDMAVENEDTEEPGEMAGEEEDEEEARPRPTPERRGRAVAAAPGPRGADSIPAGGGGAGGKPEPNYGPMRRHYRFNRS